MLDSSFVKFKQWLENFDFVWDSTKKVIVPGISINIPTDIQFSVTKSNQMMVLDVSNSSMSNPVLKIALQNLIHSHPEFSNYLLKFDGFLPNKTVKEFLDGESVETLPSEVYTGTSTQKFEKIKIEGLRPRELTGSGPVHGKHMPSQTDRVYFSTSIGNVVKFAAREAAGDGSTPIILAINTEMLSAGKLMPDEDSNSSNWKDSIHRSGTFSYQGVVNANFIKPVLIWNKENRQWEQIG